MKTLQIVYTTEKKIPQHIIQHIEAIEAITLYYVYGVLYCDSAVPRDVTTKVQYYLHGYEDGMTDNH